MVAVLNRIKSHAKDFDRAYFLVGDFYFRNGDSREALKQYKEGMAADPKQKATYQKRMIEVLMRQGRRTEAADINAAILKDNPKDSDARGLQASLLLDRGDVQKAISELQAVVNAAPDNFVARLQSGPRARGARRVGAGPPAVHRSHPRAPRLSPGAAGAGAASGHAARSTKRPSNR